MNPSSGYRRSFALLITLASVFLWVGSQSLKTFGETCDGDCDERQGLTCSSESKLCECMSPNSTLYDATRSLCLTRAGHPCRRIANCVSHANCPGVNLPCECDRNYFATRNGSCFLAASYGESCSSKKPCDKAAGIECVGSKNKHFQCQCKYPRDQFYDSERKTCISYAGGNCSFTLPCVKNAGCSKEIFELKKGELHGKSYYYNATVGRKCACLPGFRRTKSRQCQSTYQSPCDDNNNNNVCNSEENLKCFDNKICLCQNPLHQIYSPERHNCLNLVGSKCQVDSECISNAECSQGICSCKRGFSVSPSRHCLKDFGETCLKDECNIFRGLSCHNNGMCNCLDDALEYSSGRKTCESSEGSFCGRFSFSLENGIQLKEGSTENCAKSLQNITEVAIQCKAGLTCQSKMGYMQCA